LRANDRGRSSGFRAESPLQRLNLVDVASQAVKLSAKTSVVPDYRCGAAPELASHLTGFPLRPTPWGEHRWRPQDIGVASGGQAHQAFLSMAANAVASHEYPWRSSARRYELSARHLRRDPRLPIASYHKSQLGRALRKGSGDGRARRHSRDGQSRAVSIGGVCTSTRFHRRNLIDLEALRTFRSVCDSISGCLICLTASTENGRTLAAGVRTNAVIDRYSRSGVSARVSARYRF